jgi:hypothetical protein
MSFSRLAARTCKGAAVLFLLSWGASSTAAHLPSRSVITFPTIPPSIAPLLIELDFSVAADAERLMQESIKLTNSAEAESDESSDRGKTLGKLRSVRSRLVKRIPEIRSLADGVRVVRATQRAKRNDLTEGRTYQ